MRWEWRSGCYGMEMILKIDLIAIGLGDHEKFGNEIVKVVTCYPVVTCNEESLNSGF